MDHEKFEKDVTKNHDRADVKAALDRETADGPGFEDEGELDQYAQLPDAEVLNQEEPKDSLEDLK